MNQNNVPNLSVGESAVAVRSFRECAEIIEQRTGKRISIQMLEKIERRALKKLRAAIEELDGDDSIELNSPEIPEG